MKKILPLIFSLASLICHAQNFDAGLLFGFTTSQVSGDQLTGYNKLGPRLGAFVSYPIQKKMNLQVEMQYIQKGSKKPFVKNSPQTYSLTLHYLEIPITLNYKVKEEIYLESGIGTGYLFAFKEEDEYGDIGSHKPNRLAIDFIFGAQYLFNEKTKILLRLGNSIIPFRAGSKWGKEVFDKGQYSTVLSLTLQHQMNRQ